MKKETERAWDQVSREQVTRTAYLHRMDLTSEEKGHQDWD